MRGRIRRMTNATPHPDALRGQGQHRPRHLHARPRAGDGVRLLRHRQGAAGDLRIPDEDRVLPRQEDRAAAGRPRLRPLAAGLRRLPAVVEHALVYPDAQDQAVREVRRRRRGDDVRRHPGRRGPRAPTSRRSRTSRPCCRSRRTGIDHRRRPPHPRGERASGSRPTTTGGPGRAATSASSSGGRSGSG